MPLLTNAQIIVLVLLWAMTTIYLVLVEIANTYHRREVRYWRTKYYDEVSM